MKIIAASDSFKDCMTAADVCRIIAEAIRDSADDVEVVEIPLADGGEGTAETLIGAGGGDWISRVVTGPLPEMRVVSGFGWLPKDKTAIVEMAGASGLELLDLSQRNPMKTTTIGTGELITAACRHGAAKILLCVGGSATVDLGTGAAYAMGWRFMDRDGKEMVPCGGNLVEIERIISPDEEIQAQVEVLCDVTNPLLGENGAAAVYGPQKGATSEMVCLLEEGLTHCEEQIREQLGIDVTNIVGAGAAGGLSAGAVAFMNARVVSGIETVISHTKLEEEMIDADWVITGEGRLDRQSFKGKVVSGVLQAAKKSDKKVAVMAGQINLSRAECQKEGISAVYACADLAISAAESIRECRILLARNAQRFVNDFVKNT